MAKIINKFVRSKRQTSTTHIYLHVYHIVAVSFAENGNAYHCIEMCIK